MLKNKITHWRDLMRAAEDLETLYELAEESGDASLESEIGDL